MFQELLELVRSRYLPFSRYYHKIRGQYKGASTKALYQWLSERASFFRSDPCGHGTTRSVRTEVTVERQGMTVLVGGGTTGFDTCPLCGQKLAPAEAEQARLRRQKDSTTEIQRTNFKK
jgi:hypothetical protein